MARLCFLTERLLRGWGVDHVVHRVAEGLAAGGHEVDVVCLRADRSYGSDRYRVRRLEVGMEPLETLEARIVERAGLIRQRRYDLFIVPMFPFFTVAVRLGLPFIYYEHGVVNPDGLGPRERLLLGRIREQAPRYQQAARRVAVLSRFLMHEQVSPTKHPQTDVVYNGADSYGPPPCSADVADLRRALGFAPTDEVVGYVGRVERNTYKGIDDLVEIAAAVRARRPASRFLLAGFADEASRQHFAGFPGITVYPDVPADRMPVVFGALDVGVSASRWEGFNLPLAEAQFYGRPVVAYDLAAHPEVVAPSGALVRDRAGFVEAIVALLADPIRRRKRGAEAQEFARRFTWANTVRAVSDCVTKALRPA
jgi:glycosyltransferase involved in cell wall biosynthesis